MVEWVSMVFGGRVVCNEDNAGHVFTSGAKLGWCFDWDPVGVGLVLEMVGLGCDRLLLLSILFS